MKSNQKIKWIVLLVIVLIVLGVLLLVANKVNHSNKAFTNSEKLVTDLGVEQGNTEMVYEQDKLKIGLSNGYANRGLRSRQQLELFVATMEELGAEVEVMESNADDALQIMQVELMISQGVDLLVIIPNNAEAMASIVEKAHSVGIKVLAYDRLIRNADVDLYVSFDNELIGEMQARAMTTIVPQGKYVYIGGAEIDNNAHLLKKGALKVLQPFIDNGDITIVYDQWTQNWNSEIAMINMQAALAVNNNDINAVIAANDSTAAAAIKALKMQGLAGKIPVVGQGFDLGVIDLIIEGSLSMNLFKQVKELPEVAAELAVKLAVGDTVTTNRTISNGKIDVPSILLKPILLDKSTIDEILRLEGFDSREEFYEKRKKE